MALTAKQERFVHEYLVDLNGTQAAIRAGYKASSAAEIARQNLRKVGIAERVDELKRERNEAVQVDGRWVLEGLKSIIARDPDGSRGAVLPKDLLRAYELVGKHTEIGAFVERLEVNAGENMAELILAARKRARLAAAKRNGGNSKHEEEETQP